MQTRDGCPIIEPKEINLLAQQVKIWFEQATSKFKVPSVSGCRMVAFYMLLFQDQKTRRPPYWQPVVKSTNGLLKAIKPISQEAKYYLELFTHPNCTPVKFWLNHYMKLQCQINKIRCDLENLMLIFSEEPHADLEPIRKIASVAQQAWAEANDGRYPKSFNPNDPVCKFLEHALEAMDQKCSPATISSVLRNRRRRVSARVDTFSV
jgi:hypothetical protein